MRLIGRDKTSIVVDQQRRYRSPVASTVLSSRSGVLWTGSVTVRVRPWPHQHEVAHLVLSGAHDEGSVLPHPDVIEDWMRDLAAVGYNTVRTTAVAPANASRLAQAGFTQCQRLDLLSLVIDDSIVEQPPSDLGIRLVLTLGRRLLPGSARRLEGIDRRSFGDEWSLDAVSLREAVRATHVSAVFTVGHNRPHGFVVVGHTRGIGYVQRLAVAPDHQRRGSGTALMAVAYRWLRRHRCSQVVVNTETDNHSAHGLYAKFGFRRLPNGLSVMQRDVQAVY